MLQFRTSYVSSRLRVHLVRESMALHMRIRNAEDLHGAWLMTGYLDEIYDPDKEMLWAFLLDTKNNLKHVDLITIGLASESLIHPREVFRKAVAVAASAIVLCHNHPTGDTTPSAEDIRVTRQMIDASKILQIQILDHVIVSESSYTSLRESGLVKFGEQE